MGGTFSSINGASIPRMVSLSPATGLSDGFLNLSIAGSQVYNQQLSRGGTLDRVEAFPATQASVSVKWINQTGCDSLYTVAADSQAAYFGGHERFASNPDACDTLGPGGYNAPGVEGLNAATGALFVNSANSAGYYSRARGLGADDMLITSAGLWIASDNLDGSDTCGGVSGHAGICLLPST